MRFFKALAFLPALALGAPSLEPITPRQSSPVEVTSISAAGPGCPPDSWTTQVSPDGQTLVVGFSSYQVFVGEGIPPEEREKYCDITVSLRYPLGCTTAAIDNTYHGFSELESGVSATLFSTYILSPGAAGPNNPPTTLSGSEWESGNVYTKQDNIGSTAFIATSNQQTVTYMVRTRAFLQSVNSQSFGSLSIDDLNIDINNQAQCWYVLFPTTK